MGSQRPGDRTDSSPVDWSGSVGSKSDPSTTREPGSTVVSLSVFESNRLIGPRDPRTREGL